MVAYKNMLQLAWFVDSTEYEVRAYMGMARQNFYEQDIKKCQYYLTKAVNCETEPKNSIQRLTAVEQFKKYMFPYDKKIDKWERQGFSIKRDGFDSIVDGTQKYDRTQELIDEFGSHNRLYTKIISYEAVKSKLHAIVDHALGNRVIPFYPPCDVDQALEV